MNESKRNKQKELAKQVYKQVVSRKHQKIKSYVKPILKMESMNESLLLMYLNDNIQ